MAEKEEMLRRTIGNVLRLDPEAVGEDASSETIPTWDSLNMLKIVLAIEGTFGVSYPEEEIPNATSYIRIRETLRNAGVDLS